ncbi:MAG: LacI family transcriptional regulator [Propionibacteriaceae bacterium]|jgi:DNA-binding LacI/PurR family transcriptional regulator|nr:LacI family transcriptional regulator [Propionibacteriaceae bacterium]
MVTMQDVAAAAGVSLSTVSYAINQNRPISDATRSRVLEAMSRLGYTRNAAARTLAGRRSHVLALILPPSPEGFGATIWQFVEAAATRAESHGYSLVIWPFARQDAAKVQRLVSQRLADGVLVMEIFLEDARVEALSAAKVPFTMIGRTSQLTGRSWVDIDFDAAIDTALERLAALGHRHIALLNHSAASVDAGYGAAIRTRDAFVAQAARRGLIAHHLPCAETALAGRQAVGQLWGLDPAITAVVTLNETATIGLMAELARRGWQVPGDVSILGLATSPAITSMSLPALAALQAPGAALGGAAIDQLVSVIDQGPEVTSSDADNRPDRSRLLPCSFISGDSLGPASLASAKPSARSTTDQPTTTPKERKSTP